MIEDLPEPNVSFPILLMTVLPLVKRVNSFSDIKLYAICLIPCYNLLHKDNVV